MVKALFKFIMTGVDDQDQQLRIWSRLMDFRFNRCDAVEACHIASQSSLQRVERLIHLKTSDEVQIWRSRMPSWWSWGPSYQKLFSAAREAWISPKVIRCASVEVQIWRCNMPSWWCLGPSYRKSGYGAQLVSGRMLQSVYWSDAEVRHNEVWCRHVGRLWPFGFGAMTDLLEDQHPI